MRACVHAKWLQSCPALCNPMDCSPPASSLCPWNCPGKNTWVGCCALLQRILPTQRSNPRLLQLLHWQAGSFPLAPPGKPLAYSKGSINDRCCYNQTLKITKATTYRELPTPDPLLSALQTLLVEVYQQPTDMDAGVTPIWQMRPWGAKQSIAFSRLHCLYMKAWTDTEVYFAS